MIEVRNVSKYYGAHAAVRALNFAVPQGEVVGLLGLNGAGKTTLLRLLSGLLVPTTGEVLLGGVNMADDPAAVRGRIGFLPETPPLYDEMTVRAFLHFVARIHGVGGDTAAALDAALAATDLLAVQHEPIGTLSHGYRRRVGIAQAVVHSPQLVLLDEPTGGLDPLQVVHMRRLIRALRGRHTVVVSSHLLGEVHALCDRLLVLGEGRLLAQGKETELAARVKNTHLITLEARGDPDALQALLARQPGVRQVELGRVTPAGVELRLVLTADVRAALAQAVLAAGFALVGLYRRQLALEGIFLALMGEQGQQAEAGETADAAAPKTQEPTC